MILCLALLLHACSENPNSLIKDFCDTQDVQREVNLAKRISQLQGKILIYYVSSNGLPVGGDAHSITGVNIIYDGKQYQKLLANTNVISEFSKYPKLFGLMDPTIKLIENFANAKAPAQELAAAKALIASRSTASFDFQDSNHTSLGPLHYLDAKYVTIRYGTNVMQRAILHSNTVGVIILSE